MQSVLIFIIFFSYFKLGFTYPQTEFQSNMQEINQYIEQTWSILTRDNASLLADSDEKLPYTQSIIYIPQEENLNKIKNTVSKNWPEWKKRKSFLNTFPRTFQQ